MSATDDQRCPLVQADRFDFQNPPLAVGGHAAGLLGEKGDRIGFVEQS